ncbi:MAG: ketol-acid reductoisomerase [bacterium]|nr:ketol-acid reductoisomerase [bacterium]MBU1917902.1 ketol-acid reductoisomerase [bacterium]
MVQVYYDKDTDLDFLKNKKIVIFGYGSQGRAHALNLHDSGLDVLVALRKDSPSIVKTQKAGLLVCDDLSEAAKQADVAAIMIPDELQKELYESHIHDNLKSNAAILFCHGFNIHYERIIPRSDMDVLLVAPKSPGPMLRTQYLNDMGVPCLLAVEQNASGQAKDFGLAYAAGIGGGRAGILETTFKDETETDLFGEQAVLCGGVSRLIQTGFETLVEAGYPAELAYFECLHELKLIIDLIYQGGFAHMEETISNTAEYGALTRGPFVIDDHVKTKMQKVLHQVQSGSFAKEWVSEYEVGCPKFQALRNKSKDHTIEKVGAKLRGMMPWLMFKN